MERRYTVRIPGKLTMVSVDELYRIVPISQGTCSVTFDFSDVSFVTPHSLILIVTASRFLRDRFNRIVVWTNI